MDDFMIDVSNVLSFVDEYNLYCHYLEFEPELRCNYTSPLRPDDVTPSFGIFPCRKHDVEYFWKDAGGQGLSGDIFKLVQLLYGYSSRYDAIARIKSDFGLGSAVERREKIVRSAPVIKEPSDIRIKPVEFTSSHLDYWKQFNVNKNLLERYRTSPFSVYFMQREQRTPFFAPYHSYAYRVYDRYQLYFPFRQNGSRFRTDMMETHVHGIEQLEYNSSLLIITKSRKDVMCLRSFGYEAVSPRSENTPMPEKFFSWADQHYEKKLVLFDNDTKHRADWYPYPQVYIPIDTGCKDISDFTRDYSPHSAAELLRQLTQ